MFLFPQKLSLVFSRNPDVRVLVPHELDVLIGQVLTHDCSPVDISHHERSLLYCVHLTNTMASINNVHLL